MAAPPSSAIGRLTTEQVVETFAQAAEANRQTPTRSGNCIVLSPEVADEVMVVGDLHGHRENFEAALRIADLAGNPRRHLVLQEVCHGGPPDADGGCQSHLMLAEVAALKLQFPERLHFLVGNHELAEAVDYPIGKGNKVLNLLFRLGLQRTYADEADRVRAAAVQFIRSSVLAVRAGDVFISHSLPEDCDTRPLAADVFERQLADADLLPEGDAFRLTWGRDYRPENARAFANAVQASVLVQGHEPVEAGWSAPNDVQVILDACHEGGAYVMIPLGQPLSQADVIERIRPLR